MIVTPAVAMRWAAAGLAIAAASLLAASAGNLGALRGAPLTPDGGDRLDLLRLTLAALAAVAAAFCLLRRGAADWRPLQQLVFAVPFAAIAVVALYKLRFGVRDRAYLRFIREDGAVEYATAGVFLLACLVAAGGVLRSRDLQTRAVLALFAAGLLFIALSEISFGQRLIGMETPDSLLAINRQQEISLHNIYGIEFVVYGVMPFVIFGYALFSRAIAGALARSGLGRHLSPDLLAVAAVPWYAVGYFLPMAIFSAKKLTVPDDVWQDQEPAELFLALGFLLVALHAFVVLARPAAEPAPPGRMFAGADGSPRAVGASARPSRR